jgi:hypothetical protein
MLKVSKLLSSKLYSPVPSNPVSVGAGRPKALTKSAGTN